jgi:hypothetical protein
MEDAMRTYQTTVLAIVLAGFASSAFAQAAAPDKDPPGTAAPPQLDLQSRQSQRGGESLSERLERSGGVIKPPEHADKDIHLTPPATGDNMNLPPSALPPSKNPVEKGTPK